MKPFKMAIVKIGDMVRFNEQAKVFIVPDLGPDRWPGLRTVHGSRVIEETTDGVCVVVEGPDARPIAKTWLELVPKE